jgi:hypothetical protein
MAVRCFCDEVTSTKVHTTNIKTEALAPKWKWAPPNNFVFLTTDAISHLAGPIISPVCSKHHTKNLASKAEHEHADAEVRRRSARLFAFPRTSARGSKKHAGGHACARGTDGA